MGEKLRKGMFVVLAANILNLVLSLARNFILPKYLDIGVYADLKTFQLYTSYGGLAALGYIDGMYLKYGGKDVSELNGEGFNRNLSTFRIFQIFLMILFVCVGSLLKDVIFVSVALAIAFLNLADYFKCFYQAVGAFSSYSRIMNLSSVLIFAADFILLFAFKMQYSTPYLLSNVAVYALVWLILEIALYRKLNVKPKYFVFSKEDFKQTIRSGFLLMMGLLMSNFLLGIDRWFVKYTFDEVHFAMYSFAASVLGFLSYAVSPISITLYNYFCTEKEEGQLKFARGAILIFGVFLIACAFPVKFILEVYLQKYFFANKIMFILFAAQIIYILIKCYFVNLYKACDKKNVFFSRIIIVVVFSVILNIVLHLLVKDMMVYAIATTISSVLWLILCCIDFKQYRCNILETLFIVLSALIFVACGLFLKSYLGFVVYVVSITILCLILMRKHFVYCLGIAKNFFKRKIRIGRK